MSILLILAAIVGLILLIASRRPDTMRIERTIDIQAPAERIFPLLNNFRQWTGWSPWEQLDPNLQRTYTGADEGRGARYAWVGNKKVGEGRMEILESVAPSRVSIRLEFIKPWTATNRVDLTLSPTTGGTRLDWLMTGANPLVSRVFGLFMDMDAMIGKDFEKGLAGIKRLAETDG